MRKRSKAIELQLQAGATETRDIYRDDGGWPFDVRKLYDLARPLEFHGYVRSGFGMNGEGGKMEAFKGAGCGREVSTRQRERHLRGDRPHAQLAAR
jgi:hypothetical protein